MGNTSSSISHKTESATILSDYRSTGITRYDDYFQKSQQVLRSAERLRFGLQEARECAADTAGTWRLRNYRFIETIRVMFWALSAAQNGDIKKNGVRILGEPPFIVVDKSILVPETALLVESFYQYFKALMEGPDLLRNIADNLLQMNQKAPGLVEDAEAIALRSKLLTSQAMYLVGCLGTNGKLLPCEMEKAKALVNYVEIAYQDMQEFLPMIPDLLAEADVVGREASNSGLLKPLEIFLRYHPGDKKTIEEVKVERKRSIGFRKQ